VKSPTLRITISCRQFTVCRVFVIQFWMCASFCVFAFSRGSHSLLLFVFGCVFMNLSFLSKWHCEQDKCLRVTLFIPNNPTATCELFDDYVVHCLLDHPLEYTPTHKHSVSVFVPSNAAEQCKSKWYKLLSRDILKWFVSDRNYECEKMFYFMQNVMIMKYTINTPILNAL